MRKEQGMSEPTARLDARFSAPGAEPTPWAAALEVLETAQLSWISTVRRDGRPHVTPLVAVWFDGALWFTTGAGEQKGVNLSANPRVVITTGCNTWDRGLDVVVEGEAVRETDDAVLARLAAAWLRKWDGDSWHFEARDGTFQHANGPGVALVFRVTPRKVLAFGKDTSTHTTYDFASSASSAG
jgi:general stress protein 26